MSKTKNPKSAETLLPLSSINVETGVYGPNQSVASAKLLERLEKYESSLRFDDLSEAEQAEILADELNIFSKIVDEATEVDQDGGSSIFDNADMVGRLSDVVVRNGGIASLLWRLYDRAEELQETERYAETLSNYFMLKEAYHIQYGKAEERAVWNERFTKRGIETYGNVDRTVLANAAAAQIAEGSLSGKVLEVYRQLAGDRLGNIESPLVKQEVFDQLGDAVKQKHQAIFEVIEPLSDRKYTSEEVREIFSEIVAKLAEQDDGWSEWSVVDDKTKSMLSVQSRRKQIIVPTKRRPIKTHTELLGLALHEIGVHAHRAVQGIEKSESLGFGMNGYTEFEEGFGSLMEYLVSGVLPQKNIDRYIDISLALGVGVEKEMDRSELLSFVTEREKQRTDKDTLSDAAKNKIETHVNRIFRGGTGMRAADGSPAAVFVKDITYYTGMIKALDYIVGQLELGNEPLEVLDYLLEGKFDPTNQAHIEHLNQFV